MMQRISLVSILVFWTTVFPFSGASADEDRMTETNEIHSLISAWKTGTARGKLTELLKKQPTDPALRFAEGRLLYFEGAYGDALERLEELAAELGPEPPELIVDMVQQVKKTHEALKDFNEQRSSDGRFLVKYTGRDAILVPTVIDVLRKADESLSKDFGFKPTGQVVVEIYPNISFLSAVTSLTEEDIETSGTIALCKYNRLMVTSPRALVRGYQWRDTLAHEYVHYYLTKMSGNVVPIWLHEGIAKFQETRWHKEPGQPLVPPKEDLLSRSAKSDQLITFDQMHPSMAKLPSQEAASLAFAQVHTVIDFLYRKKGYEGLRKLIKGLMEGNCIPTSKNGCRREMNRALKKVFGFGLKGLWKNWKRDLAEQGLKTYPGLVQRSLKFKRPGMNEEEDSVDFDTIDEKRVKDYAHLGELLRARGRSRAALSEYKKAIKIGGDGNPLVQNGAAAAMLNIGLAKDVPETLDRVLRYYPNALKTHLNLGEAYMESGKIDAAISSFEAVIGINPFHPRPYAALLRLYEQSGRTEDLARIKKTMEILK